MTAIQTLQADCYRLSVDVVNGQPLKDVAIRSSELSLRMQRLSTDPANQGAILALLPEFTLVRKVLTNQQLTDLEFAIANRTSNKRDLMRRWNVLLSQYQEILSDPALVQRMINIKNAIQNYPIFTKKELAAFTTMGLLGGRYLGWKGLVVSSITAAGYHAFKQRSNPFTVPNSDEIPPLTLQVVVQPSSVAAPVPASAAPTPLQIAPYTGNNQWIRFFLGQGTDDQNRSLAEILAKDNDWLEHTHNYIQRLFLNFRRSRADGDAPLLTTEVQNAFLHGPQREVLKQNLRQCFIRMLQFYGFVYENGAVQRNMDPNSPNSFERRKQWLWINGHHNFLRITRILTALKDLGLQEEANAFYGALYRVYSDPTPIRLEGTTPRTAQYEIDSAGAFLFWQNVVFAGRTLTNPLPSFINPNEIGQMPANTMLPGRRDSRERRIHIPDLSRAASWASAVPALSRPSY